MKKQVADCRYIKPLYTLCNILAILPPHVFGNNPSRTSVCFKIYTVIHIFIAVGIYIHSSYGRENYVYNIMDVTVSLTDKLANFTLSSFNVVLRFILVFYNDRTIKTFLNDAYEISKQSEFVCFTTRSFQMQFLAFNLYMAFLLVFDTFVWIRSVGFKMFQFYLGRSLMYYTCNTMIFFMFQSALLIKHLFASLNNSLETITKNLVCNDVRRQYILTEFKMVKSSTITNYQCFDIKRIRKLHNKICSLVDSFNDAYGFVILSVILVIITYILNLTDLVLVYAVDKTKSIDGAQYGAELIILCGFWIITLLMFSVFLAHSCANAVLESEKLSIVCFVWLNEIPTIPTSHVATSRRPKFSAAGFFTVDFTLLGFIIGSVTSYIIISYKEFDDKKIVKLLHRISQTLGLSIPNLYNYDGLAVCYLIYSFMICVILLGLCIYTLYVKIAHFYFGLIITAAILETISISGGTATNIISILSAVVLRRRKIVQAVKNIKEIEKALNEKFDVICQLDEKGLFLQFICLEVLIVLYIIYDSTFKIVQHGFSHFSLAVIMYLNMFLISINVMQVQLVSTCMKQYFQMINERLSETMQYPVTMMKTNETANSKFRTVKMKFFLKIYDKLCDVIDLVSKSYGIQIVFVAFIIIIGLIESMNLLMKFALKMDSEELQLRVTFLIATLWKSVIYIIFGVMLAINCEQTSEEANNTSVICYKILLNFPSCPKSHSEEVTKNELMLLAEHLSQRKVKFSAAGFFTVDHSMLYMIFGSIAAYLVVVLQFK
ncbi:uncharacterized protein BDFB_000669 [Asbolus verrucosus]|uniref:Gustatory receptor n=1 Tax=Asbolus verrucosus TaxID=1661398 RepID=A0A482W386_ASBVE|nr:uncharacterized protein BDFB_000669 [Asbolus verrucosus]